MCLEKILRALDGESDGNQYYLLCALFMILAGESADVKAISRFIFVLENEKSLKEYDEIVMGYVAPVLGGSGICTTTNGVLRLDCECKDYEKFLKLFFKKTNGGFKL